MKRLPDAAGMNSDEGWLHVLSRQALILLEHWLSDLPAVTEEGPVLVDSTVMSDNAVGSVGPEWQVSDLSPSTTQRPRWFPTCPQFGRREPGHPGGRSRCGD
jgi:hypothetical protein